MARSFPSTTSSQPSPFEGESSSTVSRSSSSHAGSQSLKGQNDPAAETGHPPAAEDARPKEPTVPAACLGCVSKNPGSPQAHKTWCQRTVCQRSKHLKCDGQSPCSRCVSSSLECIYVASRRGYKGPRRGTASNGVKRQATSPPDSELNGTDCPMLLGAGTSVSPFNSGLHLSSDLPTSGQYLHSRGGGPEGQRYRVLGKGTTNTTSLVSGHDAGQIDPYGPVKSLPERCEDAFFYYFHGSHPFVLPQDWFQRIAKSGGLEALQAAIRWAGSLYVNNILPMARDGLLDEAYRLVQGTQTPKDGFLVQALMILIVGLDGSCQQEKARELLGEAERRAIEIGLNTGPFASLHGRNIPVLEESWRRTWWDLFIIDGMIAGVHRMTKFLLFDVPTDVALPCEEYQYLSGQIPPPLYLEQLEDREFASDHGEFSSFAYRILCGRNLGKFMRTPPIFGPDDENLARIEALLSNWRLHLPESKRNMLQKNGRLDEMMFQAQMMLNATSILLHQPHSQLDSSPAQSITSCAPHQAIASGDYFNVHTRHTIAAAGAISQLITHPVPLLSHTHFFTCVVTLSSIVHLSKWALYFIPQDDDDLRQQIKLNIGALNALSEVWGAADRARGQVRGVAQEIYQAKKQQQLMNPQYWLSFSQEQVVETMAADDSIINDIAGVPTVQGQVSGL